MSLAADHHSRVRRSAFLTAGTILLVGAVAVLGVQRLGPSQSVASMVGSDDVKDIPIHARSWGFTPKVIHVEPGDTVRFRVVSDDVNHGFAIPELGLNLQLAPDREVRSPAIKFGLPAGKYTIHCSTFCGLGHSSMKASLIVGDPPPAPMAKVPWLASLLTLGAAGAFTVFLMRRPR